jgi:hypothetical protein
MAMESGNNDGDMDGNGDGDNGGEPFWPRPHVFLADLGLSHTRAWAILDALPSILCRWPWLS